MAKPHLMQIDRRNRAIQNFRTLTRQNVGVDKRVTPKVHQKKK